LAPNCMVPKLKRDAAFPEIVLSMIHSPFLKYLCRRPKIKGRP